MKIGRINGIAPSSSDDNPKREQKRFESAREIDRKKTEYERYRREADISKEEFLKQKARARKIGFDAMLKDEMDK